MCLIGPDPLNFVALQRDRHEPDYKHNRHNEEAWGELIIAAMVKPRVAVTLPMTALQKITHTGLEVKRDAAVAGFTSRAKCTNAPTIEADPWARSKCSLGLIRIGCRPVSREGPSANWVPACQTIVVVRGGR